MSDVLPHNVAQGPESVEPSEASLRELERLMDESDATKHAFVVQIGDHIDDPAGTEALIVELLSEAGYEVDAVIRTGSVKREIRKALETAVIGGADLVITIGGVGVGPRAVAPEATRKVLDIRIQGIEQAVRASGLTAGALDAGLSRGLAGISGQTVVVNLAESRAAIRDGMATVTPLVSHVLAELGKCEFSG